MTMQNSKLKNVKIVSRNETPKFCPPANACQRKFAAVQS